MAAQASAGWSDEVECNGDTVLVANVDDFAHWFGQAVDSGGLEAIHHYGPANACYLWRVAPGMVTISVDSTRGRLCLAQIEYADSDADRAAARAYALAFDGLQQASGLHYRVDKGPVVAVCATNSVQDTSTSIARLPLSGASPGGLIDFAGGPNAAALWLVPGLYASSLFFHEEDRWGVSWCRLQRVSD